jgi:hypothetical protein
MAEEMLSIGYAREMRFVAKVSLRVHSTQGVMELDQWKVDASRGLPVFATKPVIKPRR